MTGTTDTPAQPTALPTGLLTGLPTADAPGVVVLRRSDQDVSTPPDPQRRVYVVKTRDTIKYGAREDGTLTLCFTKANHYLGRPSWDSDKQFSRWSTDEVRHVAAKPGEPWRLARLEKKAGRTRWHRSPVFAETQQSLPPGYVEMARDLLPAPPSLYDYYPLLNHYLGSRPLPQPIGFQSPAVAWAPAGVRRAFVRTTTVQDLTRRLFGKTRYRRDLVKAVAQTNLPTLSFAWQFRGLVPIDWIVTMLRERRIPSGWCMPLIRPHLRELDLQSLRNLIRDVPRDHLVLFDLIRYPASAGLPRIHNWSELHDQVIEHAVVFVDAFTKNGTPRKPIRLPAYAAALAADLPSGARIEIARHEDTLWVWGKQMRHCIGSYGRDMRSGRSLLGAVYDTGDRLRGNFEVVVSGDAETRRDPVSGDPVAEPAPVQLRLSQFLGFKNSIVPDPLHGEVIEHLRRHEVTVPERYWGRADTHTQRAA